MPHSWVGSDYMRSVLDMLAYYRQGDQALVLAAGVQESWIEGSGVTVKNLPIFTGKMGFRLRRGPEGLEMEVDGRFELPPGGVVVRLPGIQESSEAAVDGRPAPFDSGGELRLHRLPAHIVVTP